MLRTDATPPVGTQAAPAAAGPSVDSVSPIVPSAITSAGTTGMRTFWYSADGTDVRTAPLTRNVIVPPSSTVGSVTTASIARTWTPAGTCTANALVPWVAVDMVPGMSVTPACAGAAGAASSAAAGSVTSAPTSPHARGRRAPAKAPFPRTGG